MLFSSIPFLYYFLPAVVLLYLLAPKRARNAALLLASLVFYGWGEPKYLLLMAADILLGYGFGLLLERRRSRALLALAVAGPVALLAFFKYSGFLLGGLFPALLRIALPIGISFYTFQILSYLIDVWRGETAAQRSLLDFAAYVALFPQLVAGPIVRYSSIAAELTDRRTDWDGAAEGLQRFLLGLGKKVLLANVLGELVERCGAASSVLGAWLAAVAYALQIYFDFSGYSDMAIGLGRFFGFHFPENFRYPFLSRSAAEFWRRWHITLGSWFRDYVYIPLGGSRVSKWKWVRNLLIVWALTGLWHGAAWNFVLWGLFFAALLLFERLTRWNPPAPLAHAYVLLAVVLSFVIFRGAGPAEFGALFGLGVPAATAEAVYALRSFGPLLLVAMVGSTPLPCRVAAALSIRLPRPLWEVLRCLVLAALLLLCTASLVDGSFNPFLYFRF